MCSWPRFLFYFFFFTRSLRLAAVQAFRVSFSSLVVPSPLPRPAPVDSFISRRPDTSNFAANSVTGGAGPASVRPGRRKTTEYRIRGRASVSPTRPRRPSRDREWHPVSVVRRSMNFLGIDQRPCAQRLGYRGLNAEIKHSNAPSSTNRHHSVIPVIVLNFTS